MIVNAFCLAAFSVTGLVFVFSKLPRKVRRWIKRHGLFADVMALILTYMLFGGTVTALMAASLAGIMTSVLIFVQQHPDDFLFLSDFFDFLKVQVNNLKKLALEFGSNYRERKLAEVNG